MKFKNLLVHLILMMTSTLVHASDVQGTGSMIAGPLIKAWAEVYASRVHNSAISYKSTSPADGIKRLINKEVDFSGIDMPMASEELRKNGLLQFPFALGAIAPIVNLPNVYPGQFRLEGKTLADIFLGNITKWNDKAIAELNPTIQLPNTKIIIIHRTSPEGLSTIIGDYLAKIHPQWRATKKDGMAGTWPENSIAVDNPLKMSEMVTQTKYSIGYGPVALTMKNHLAYVQMKNQSGHFVSPSDENISAAATNATWDERAGFNVVLSDQPGATSWPITSATFVLMRKQDDRPERSKEVLKYFKYSLRYGGLKAVQYDYIPLPETVVAVVRTSWKNVVDQKGEPVLKN